MALGLQVRCVIWCVSHVVTSLSSWFNRSCRLFVWGRECLAALGVWFLGAEIKSGERGCRSHCGSDWYLNRACTSCSGVHQTRLVFEHLRTIYCSSQRFWRGFYLFGFVALNNCGFLWDEQVFVVLLNRIFLNCCIVSSWSRTFNGKKWFLDSNVISELA